MATAAVTDQRLRKTPSPFMSVRVPPLPRPYLPKCHLGHPPPTPGAPAGKPKQPWALLVLESRGRRGLGPAQEPPGEGAREDAGTTTEGTGLGRGGLRRLGPGSGPLGGGGAGPASGCGGSRRRFALERPGSRPSDPGIQAHRPPARPPRELTLILRRTCHRGYPSPAAAATASQNLMQPPPRKSRPSFRDTPGL